MRKPHCLVVYDDSLWIDVDSHPIWAHIETCFNRFAWMYGYYYIPQPFTSWRRGIYEQVGIMDER
jgi:hypothetical protein